MVSKDTINPNRRLLKWYTVLSTDAPIQQRKRSQTCIIFAVIFTADDIYYAQSKQFYKCERFATNFDRFPRNDLCKAWVDQIGRDDWQPNTNSRICSVHFEEHYMYKTEKNTTRLSQDAIPTIFPSPEKNTADEFCGERDKAAFLNGRLQRENEHLKQIIREKNLMIQSLLGCKCRSKKRIVKISSALKVLKQKHLITQEQLSRLVNISIPLAELTRKQGGVITFSPELRNFAVTLNRLSPSGYSYLRRVFDTCLPHPNTIKKWYDAETGSIYPTHLLEQNKNCRNVLHDHSYPSNANDLLHELSEDALAYISCFVKQEPE